MARTTASHVPVASFTDYSRTLDRSLANAIPVLPSWIWLAMIVIATAAICVTVNFRGYSQLNSAEHQLHQMQAEIAALRQSNASLQAEVLRITTEPTTIESAARARLGMVRPTDVIVPIHSRSDTNLASVSFVR